MFLGGVLVGVAPPLFSCVATCSTPSGSSSSSPAGSSSSSPAGSSSSSSSSCSSVSSDFESNGGAGTRTCWVSNLKGRASGSYQCHCLPASSARVVTHATSDTLRQHRTSCDDDANVWRFLVHFPANKFPPGRIAIEARSCHPPLPRVTANGTGPKRQALVCVLG